METTKVDQRREAGLRTRARLLDAALDLLAERGEDGVTLRDLTEAADANVAAVSYHFGSLKALLATAMEQALESYLDAQQEALDALPPNATLEDLATAFARPIMRHLTAGGRELAVLRIVARAAFDPPESWRRFDARFDRHRAAALPVLRANVPGVKDHELVFRTTCVAGMLTWLVAPVGDELRARPEKQLERLLVPIIAGAFRGTTAS